MCNEGEGECASAVDNYMEQFEEVVRYSLPKGKSVAAFFAESIQVSDIPLMILGCGAPIDKE